MLRRSLEPNPIDLVRSVPLDGSSIVWLSTRLREGTRIGGELIAEWRRLANMVDGRFIDFLLGGS